MRVVAAKQRQAGRIPIAETSVGKKSVSPLLPQQCQRVVVVGSNPLGRIGGIVRERVHVQITLKPPAAPINRSQIRCAPADAANVIADRCMKSCRAKPGERDGQFAGSENQDGIKVIVVRFIEALRNGEPVQRRRREEFVNGSGRQNR